MDSAALAADRLGLGWDGQPVGKACMAPACVSQSVVGSGGGASALGSAQLSRLEYSSWLSSTIQQVMRAGCVSVEREKGREEEADRKRERERQ